MTLQMRFLTYWVEQKISKRRIKSKKFTTIVINTHLVEVRKEMERYIIDFNNDTCTCGKFQQLKLHVVMQ